MAVLLLLLLYKILRRVRCEFYVKEVVVGFVNTFPLPYNEDHEGLDASPGSGNYEDKTCIFVHFL